MVKRIQRIHSQVTGRTPPNILIHLSMSPEPQPSEKVELVSTSSNVCGCTPVVDAPLALSVLIKNQTAARRLPVGTLQVADGLQLYENQPYSSC